MSPNYPNIKKQNFRMSTNSAPCIAGLTALIFSTAWAYPPPPPDPTLPASPVEPAVQQLRREMLDADVSSLMFHSMDQLLTTRTVARSWPVWVLPRPRSFMAIGLQGQYIYVDPMSQTVVVKLSYFPPGDMEPHDETEAFLAAVSAWAPH